MVWFSYLLKNFPQFVAIHTVKGFGIVNKAEIDIFLELCSFFNDPTDVGNLISGSSAFSKTSLNIQNFMVCRLLNPGLDNFEHYFASLWDECNHVIVWSSFGTAFLWDWKVITFSYLSLSKRQFRFFPIYHELFSIKKLQKGISYSTIFSNYKIG